jgi:glycosyltransferase involved in cell wall biosynthesis
VRIAHVTDHFWPRVGGIEVHVARLAALQADAGHEVVVLTGPGGSAPNPDITVRQRTRLGIAAIGPIDVAHIHVSLWSPGPFRALRDCVRTRTPTVVTVHSVCGRYRPLLALLNRVVRWGSWPIAWTAVSDVAADPLRAIVGDEVEVSVLPNGIDLERWRVDRDQPRSAEVLVVSVARLAARKRPLTLLWALRRARRAIPSHVHVRAVIVGDGRLRPIMRALNAVGRTRSWIMLPGRMTHAEIHSLFRDADLFVAAARLESFGIAALEARCAGLPIIAFAGTGIEGFVRDEHDGLLVSHGRDLGQTIARLACDARTRDLMASCAIESVAQFEWDVVLKLTDEEYKRARRLSGATGANEEPGR